MPRESRINRLDLRLRYQHWTADSTVGTNIDVIIDGEPLADYGYYATNVLGLVHSVDYDGGFFIVVCTCGDSGCAGIFSPILVTHKSGRVCWNVQEPVPAREFRFDEEQYRNEIMRLLDAGFDLAREGTLTDVIPRDNQEFFEQNPALAQDIEFAVKCNLERGDWRLPNPD